MKRLMGEMSPLVRWVFVSAWMLTATMLVVVIVLYTDNKRTKECISTYMVKDQEATAARIAASEKSNTAEDNFYRDFAAYAGDRSQENAAKAAQSLTELAAERAKLKQALKDNPPPKVPTQCAE